MMAHHFRTEHYEVVLHAGDMEQVMGDLIWHLEDLRVGQSYPNYYVARLASRFVKVVLSGSGGDELFGGYPWRYFQVAGSRSPDEFFRNYYAFWQRLIPEDDKPRLFNAATLRAIAGHSTMDVFRDVFAGHDMPLESQQDYVNHSLYFEARTFLHGLLVVEDKISMAHGLESRVPFLDNALVDFAMRVPVGFKLEAGLLREAVDEDDIVRRQRFRRSAEGKTVLRKAMQRLIPPEIIERKKQGFTGPYESWYRGESLDYIRRLLTSPRARYREFLDPGFVENVLAEHQSATCNHRLLIWSLLCFEVWLRRFM
jgi:asparagine synthase (glutamine-hydrolysing)